MKENIIVVGTGSDVLSVKNTLSNLGHNDVIIIPQEAEPFPKSEPYTIHTLSPKGGKQFICKGKHEYRKVERKEEFENGSIVKVEWICQCGRKTTD